MVAPPINKCRRCLTNGHPKKYFERQYALYGQYWKLCAQSSNEASASSLLQSCADVAAASGGLFTTPISPPEQKLLEDLARQRVGSPDGGSANSQRHTNAAPVETAGGRRSPALVAGVITKEIIDVTALLERGE